MKRSPSANKVLRVTPAGEGHQVISIVGNVDSYCKTPCPECPWRVANDGSFPAEAFRVSARTAYDIPDALAIMAETGEKPGTFLCHMTGKDHPATCAGFLLRGAENSLSVRMARHGFADVIDDGSDLHPSYRSMAIANGVPPNDPAIAKCRDGSFARKQR